ncbi:unnamed protein product [marine sediment metagenome]|uniref:Uncharacterized protein n=1 Tax=marine sediment metagenome TaxID=412755 RepID=X0SFZ9_9ZZZZ
MSMSRFPTQEVQSLKYDEYIRAIGDLFTAENALEKDPENEELLQEACRLLEARDIALSSYLGCLVLPVIVRESEVVLRVCGPRKRPTPELI